MNGYFKYKNWWFEWAYHEVDTGRSLEEQFEDHINSIPLYELMETLCDFEEEE
jgi:hypothetical protein